MAFELDLSKVDNPGEGPERVPPGCYHVLIQDFVEYGSDKGDHVCKFEVLAGTIPNQEGRTHTEYFSQKDTVAWRLARLAAAAAMYSPQEMKAMKAAGKNPEFDGSKLKGKQLCIVLDEEHYEKDGVKKSNIRIKGGGEMYALDDPRSASFPVNAGMLKRAGIVRNVGNEVPAPAASAPVNAPAAKEPSLDDLYGSV